MASHPPTGWLDVSKTIDWSVSADSILCGACKALEIVERCNEVTLRSGEDEEIVNLSDHPAFRSLRTLHASAKSCCCCAYFFDELYRARVSKRLVMETAQGTDADDVKLNTQLVISSSKTGWRLSVIQDKRTLFATSVAAAKVSDFKPVCGVNSAPSQLWYIDRNPKSIMALHNLSKWMRACETHPVCVGSGFALLPDRCIRVGTKSLPRVRLYESSSNETGSYLALSYVWGGYSSYVLKQSSYHSFKRQMDEQTMPKTYQDAIFLARQLDVPYVWIDALCIIQDDPGDWEAQSAKMANVYGNAYLTICASRSSSALEGFLTQRLASHVLCGESGSSNNSQAAYLFRSPHPHLNQRYSTSEPITSRAWCVQERVLSPRKVHFCSRGTIWECRTTMLSEQGDEYVPSTKAFASFVEGGAVDRWAEILSEYTGCHLTIESDRLPALSGIASRFASATGDEFLSGHWLSQLPLSLLWHRGYSRLRLARSYRAPSWAWPSVEGRIMLYTLDQQLLLEILGYECKSAGPNPFGNVANAWLKVRGPLISIEASALEAASLEQRPHIFYHCEFKISLAGCTSEVDASIALDMPMNATIVHLLVVARDINAEANLTGKHCYNCVILTSNMSQSDTYSRVGMAIIKCGPELSCGFAQHDMVLV